MNDEKLVVEALIYASPEPLEEKKIQEIMGGCGHEITTEEVTELIQTLQMQYQGQEEEPLGSSLALIKVAGGYAFRTKAFFSPYVTKMLEKKPQKLSQAQTEVLSIVSYRQPVTRISIEGVRGVDCGAAMRKLLGVGLIKTLGKSQAPGRPLLYGTTEYFLTFFGLNSLHDLPNLNDFKALEVETPQEEIIDENTSIKDLFSEDVEMFSKVAEEQSKKALQSLDAALSEVKKVAKKVSLEEKERLASENLQEEAS